MSLVKGDVHNTFNGLQQSIYHDDYMFKTPHYIYCFEFLHSKNFPKVEKTVCPNILMSRTMLYARGLKLKQAGGPHLTTSRVWGPHYTVKLFQGPQINRVLKRFYFNQNKTSENWKKIWKQPIYVPKIEKNEFFPLFSMFSWSYKMLGGRIKPSRGPHAARGPRVWGACSMLIWSFKTATKITVQFDQEFLFHNILFR
jgi:hypothetical protein